MSQNTNLTTENSPTITSDADEDFESAVIRTPEGASMMTAFKRAQEEPSPMHERIFALVNRYNQQVQGVEGMPEIPKEIIDLPAVFTDVRTDEDGDKYVTDLNNVVRYYIGLGELVPTDEFESNAMMVDSNERTNTFATLYNIA